MICFVLYFIFRRSVCKYEIIGCSWEGTKANQQEHENICDFPNKNGTELMSFVMANMEKLAEETSQLRLLVQMMSCEKISICGKFYGCTTGGPIAYY